MDPRTMANSEWLRLPGLFFKDEIVVLDLLGRQEFRFEDAGEDEFGRAAVIVFCRDPEQELVERGLLERSWRFDLSEEWAEQVKDVLDEVLQP
jgi:hypothetical protein